MDIYITVGPGLHILEFYHAEEGVLDNQSWSNDLITPTMSYNNESYN